MVDGSLVRAVNREGSWRTLYGVLTGKILWQGAVNREYALVGRVFWWAVNGKYSGGERSIGRCYL
jgi:hypothetical protein